MGLYFDEPLLLAGASYLLPKEPDSFSAAALDLRGDPGKLPQRLHFFNQVCARVMSDYNGRWTGYARVHEAEALHLVSYTLSTEFDPRFLLTKLRPAISCLESIGRLYPGVRRYVSLLHRTRCMAASKLDDYPRAYRGIMAAHRAVALAPPDSELPPQEAMQQVWLQECGQLTRLVEASMLETDLVAARAAFESNEPPRAVMEFSALWAMRAIAAHAVYAGRQCLRLFEELGKFQELLPAPVPSDRHLATISWGATARTMYARAILVKATVDMVLGLEPFRWRTRVPDLFEECVTGTSPLIRERIMELNRIALHFSFLTGGLHPMAGRIVWNDQLGTGRTRAPRHLLGSDDGRLDRLACSRSLADHNNNANFLDNLGYRQFFDLFAQRAGEGAASYVSWLTAHRQLRHGRGAAERLAKEMAAAEESHATGERSGDTGLRMTQRQVAPALYSVAALVDTAPHYVASGWQ